MSYNSELQHNNAELQEILDMADELPEAVSTEPQTLTEAQKTQARENIGLQSETWTFTLADGSTVTKKVVLA